QSYVNSSAPPSKRLRACSAVTQHPAGVLGSVVWNFIRDGHAASTSKQYDSIELFYKEVVSSAAVPFPASGHSLALFAYAMSRAGYKFATVSSYLSAMVSRNRLYGNDLSSQDEFILKMAKKSASKICVHDVDQKLPLTRDQVTQLGALDPLGGNIVVTASLCGIFALLRGDEIINLNFEDLQLCDRLGKRVARIIVRQSKIDQAGRGESVLVSCVRGRPFDASCFSHCAYHRLLILAASHKQSSSPLFEYNGGRLSHDIFMSEFRLLLSRLGMSTETLEDYGLHSLRRTGATLCYLSAVRDHTIREQGRWSSECVYEYLVDASLAERPLPGSVVGRFCWTAEDCVGQCAFRGVGCVVGWRCGAAASLLLGGGP
ncbi:hypothetical protein FOZ63_003767, partial [Perkinsus olseni]